MYVRENRRRVLVAFVDGALLNLGVDFIAESRPLSAEEDRAEYLLCSTNGGQSKWGIRFFVLLSEPVELRSESLSLMRDALHTTHIPHTVLPLQIT